MNYIISFILQSTFALGSAEPDICGFFYQVLRYLRPINRTTHNTMTNMYVLKGCLLGRFLLVSSYIY